MVLCLLLMFLFFPYYNRFVIALCQWDKISDSNNLEEKIIISAHGFSPCSLSSVKRQNIMVEGCGV